MTWILRGAEALNSPLAGGKARGLARMDQGGLPVPPWFVISASAFVESLTLDQRAAIDAASDAASAQRVLDGVALHVTVRGAIDEAIRELCPAGEIVAVRSSASEEDGAVHSFAGQLESFLNVRPGSVAERVIDVWRSAFTERMFAYQQQHGLRRCAESLHAVSIVG